MSFTPFTLQKKKERKKKKKGIDLADRKKKRGGEREDGSITFCAWRGKRERRGEGGPPFSYWQLPLVSHKGKGGKRRGDIVKGGGEKRTGESPSSEKRGETGCLDRELR